MTDDTEDFGSRADTFVGAVEAVADLLVWSQPGMGIEAERFAPLMLLLAAEARAIRGGDHSGTPRAVARIRSAND